MTSAVSQWREGTRRLTLAVLLLPSLVAAEIVTLPADNAVTTPSLSTVAMASSLLVQVKDLSVAFSGWTVCSMASFSPTLTGVFAFVSILRVLTGSTTRTFREAESVFPSGSSVVQVTVVSPGATPLTDPFCTAAICSSAEAQVYFSFFGFSTFSATGESFTAFFTATLISSVSKRSTGSSAKAQTQAHSSASSKTTETTIRFIFRFDTQIPP